MEIKKEAEWKPDWFTIEEFSNITPIDLFHKEQAPLPEELSHVPEELKNVHVLARARFSTAKDSGKLTLKVTADDHYKLYIDGKFVTEGPAAGYPEHYYYNEIPLEHMAEGEHCIALHLYYQGLVNRVYNSGDLRFAFAAELTDAQGKQISLSFCYEKLDCYHGQTIGYETQFLENFDSRAFPKGWKEIGFDDFSWKKAVKAEWADYSVEKQPTKQLSFSKRKPDKLSYYKDGSIFVDMGEEVTGYLCLTADGKAGDKVEILCGEELFKDGSVRYEMRCNCTYRELWTLADGVCELEPYDYKGFRYAMIKPKKGVTIKDIYVVTRHYPFDESSCEIQASEKKLEQIFAICKNAVKLGTQENYVDCPTREKGQYLGDAIVTAHAQVLLTGKTEMLLKCIDQFAATAKVCPGLLAVAPGGLMQEIADFSLLYPQLLLLYYRYTGDTKTLEPYYETVKNMLSHFSQYERADGLLEQVADKWNLVDWPENLRDDYDFALTRPIVGAGCHNVINALYLGSMKTVNELARVLGKEKSYNLEKRKKAFYKAFYRAESGLFADSETSKHTSLHSNVYPLYFDLVEKEEPVITFLEEKGFSCGVMLSYYMLLALAEKGRYDAVYRLLINDSAHGWGNMLKEGATTCFEAWGKEQKWNTSLCHPWASAPIPVLIEEIGGIHICPEKEEGYFFTPHIPDCVDYFKISMQMCGKRFTVTKQEQQVKLDVTLEK